MVMISNVDASPGRCVQSDGTVVHISFGRRGENENENNKNFIAYAYIKDSKTGQRFFAPRSSLRGVLGNSALARGVVVAFEWDPYAAHAHADGPGKNDVATSVRFISPQQQAAKKTPFPPNSSLQPHSTRVYRFKAVIGKQIDLEKLNHALKNPSHKLPHKLREAMANGTITVAKDRTIKFVGITRSIYYLEKIFAKSEKDGWLDWISGSSGWRLAITKKNQQIYIALLGRLGDFCKAHIAALHEKYPRTHAMRSAINFIWYKIEGSGEEYNNGEPVGRQSTKRLWKKETGSLEAAVSSVRFFLEALDYLGEEGWEKDGHVGVPWLDNVPSHERKQRLTKIGAIVHALMRSSSSGPDVPVHWASHGYINKYNRTVATDETMTELVVGLANILANLFVVPMFHQPHKTIRDVDAFLNVDNTSSEEGEIQEVSHKLQNLRVG